MSVKSKEGKGTTFTVLLPNETITEDPNKKDACLLDNRLIHTTDVEFSDIYL